MSAKKKLPELKAMAAYYGEDRTIKSIIESSIKSLPFICPKCQGAGILTQKYNAYPSGFPDSGWVDDIRTKEFCCDICNGEGRTGKEMVSRPVTVEYVAK